ncbi:hypothetical protein ERJ75_000638600 [Trypanosoma vivax]|nr:hypothetical protein ERJ75_000638600 [Trypanosoma vivax]
MLRSVRRGTPTDRRQERRQGRTRASSTAEKTGIGLRREIKQGLARCNAWEVVEGRRGKKRGKHGQQRIDMAAVTRKANVPLGADEKKRTRLCSVSVLERTGRSAARTRGRTKGSTEALPRRARVVVTGKRNFIAFDALYAGSMGPRGAGGANADADADSGGEGRETTQERVRREGKEEEGNRTELGHRRDGRATG